MSVGSSRDSAVSTDSEREDRARFRRGCTVTERLKALFCCIKREPRGSREVVDYDPDEYDYIVEKLVVKRVPFALFAIRADLDRHGSNATTTSEQASRSASSSTFYKRSDSVVARRNTSTKTAMSSGGLSHQVRSSAWQEEILDKFSTLHPNLKQSDRPPKDPLNFSQSKQLCMGNIPEMASSARTDVFSKQMTSVIVQDEPINHGRTVLGFSSKRTEKSNGSRQPQDATTEKDRGNCLPGLNRRFIVSPFRVQKGSFDFEKPTSRNDEDVDGDTGVDCKSLTYLEESAQEETVQLKKTSKEDLPNTAVKWRITIRQRQQQRANADSEAATSEVVKNS